MLDELERAKLHPDVLRNLAKNNQPKKAEAYSEDNPPPYPVTSVNGQTGDVSVAAYPGNSAIIDLIYPVGSIYMSVNSNSPAALFGGTWQQLEDRFLLGAGSSYAAGSTGGEATHKLTVAEMPSHGGHVYNDVRGGNWAGFLSTSDATPYGSSGRGWNVTAGNELHPAGDSLGGNAAHNNMPPYLAVYIWKRTA